MEVRVRMFLFFVGKTNADQNPSLLSLFGWELSFNVHYCTMLPIHGTSPRHVFGFDQFSSSSAGDLQRPIRIFQFDELSLNSTDSSVHTTVSSVRTITDGSNTSNAANLDSNGMMIPQREETGIYEDHPGLNPTYERDLGEDFERICSELYRLFYLSPDRDLPPSWPMRDCTLFILGDVDITPAYLADVYNNLQECGIDSLYWKMALDYLNLINGSYIYFDPMDLMSILSI
jgi:hypothetical protein